jgi:hypothetical protein
LCRLSAIKNDEQKENKPIKTIVGGHCATSLYSKQNTNDINPDNSA